MEKTKVILTAFSIIALSACTQSDNLIGKWTQAVPNMPQMKQGFTLHADGKASSINTATLSYEAWEKQGNQLILSGQSIGNHQTITFSDTFAIEKLTQDSLILRKGLLKLEYGREHETENKTSYKGMN